MRYDTDTMRNYMQEYRRAHPRRDSTRFRTIRCVHCGAAARNVLRRSVPICCKI